MSDLPDVLRGLVEAAGPSGYEGAPAAAFRAAAEAFGAAVASDTLGSSTATVAGRADGLSLAVVGHIDEIGLIVTHVDDDGFLWFRNVGGWDPQILVGQRVRVTTRDGSVGGVIGKKAIHLLRDEERKQVPEIRDLHIDIGAASGDDARVVVGVGDVAVIDVEPVPYPGRRLVSRALDNRLGCYVALESARLVAEAGGADATVIAVAAVQEEVGFAGSRTSAYALRPTCAIVVDVTHATDTPGAEIKASGAHALGSGPVIARGTILHPRISELLVEAADAEEIPYTLEASGRNTGTDADAVHISRAGVPTGLVSIPLRYMHSPVEMVALDDVDAAARLIAAFARRLTTDVTFAR